MSSTILFFVEISVSFLFSVSLFCDFFVPQSKKHPLKGIIRYFLSFLVLWGGGFFCFVQKKKGLERVTANCFNQRRLGIDAAPLSS